MPPPSKTIDPETQQQERVGLVNDDVNNPYKQQRPMHHPIYQLQRLLILVASCWGLHAMNVYHTIRRGENFNHEWFKIGLALCVALVALKSWVELYQGKTKKRKVNYENFRNETHAVMLLMMGVSISFHKALWVVYGGGQTMLIMALFSFGICLQLALMIPPWAWNVLAVVSLTFFIQIYV
eukprot:CAMPEP_0185725840 /NCGR_PEP_ID=MMETSP1171-20130828/1993_1 /TAXON_ID=374046 /ORGANISM="Helicotheca tamensis, Strain CCMP826" /LENGTH=180 /DNA_ID=CAMNT_0028394061 /DNA_START=119 /DNA_END=661 /DNA_ORIENTATION=-